MAKEIAYNTKARFAYDVLDTFEAGIVLVGTEVKSLRNRKVSLKESFARVRDGQLYLYNMHISPYQQAGEFNHDPTRPRKLLMHKREIQRLIGKIQAEGLTLIPLSLYFKRGKAKVKLALARGKKLFDKRETVKKRMDEREISRRMKRSK